MSRSSEPLWLLTIVAAAAVCVPMAASLAASDAGKVQELEVIELFTSQGCSSCPPADALLSLLAKESDVLALSFHVDYWNRLGWTDPFSSAEWSDRQRRYATQQASDSVYTPQMVIDGQYGFVGSDEREAKRLLRKVRAESKPVGLQLAAVREENELKVAVRAEASAAAQGGADLLLVLSEGSLSTQVPRGENRNRTLRHSNVVRSLERVAWDGANVEVSLPLEDAWAGADLRAVALLQERETLRILGAAQIAVPSARH